MSKDVYGSVGVRKVETGVDQSNQRVDNVELAHMAALAEDPFRTKIQTSIKQANETIEEEVKKINSAAAFASEVGERALAACSNYRGDNIELAHTAALVENRWITAAMKEETAAEQYEEAGRNDLAGDARRHAFVFRLDGNSWGDAVLSGRSTGDYLLKMEL